jgi:hypothetical protein
VKQGGKALFGKKRKSAWPKINGLLWCKRVDLPGKIFDNTLFIGRGILGLVQGAELFLPLFSDQVMTELSLCGC